MKGGIKLPVGDYFIPEETVNVKKNAVCELTTQDSCLCNLSLFYNNIMTQTFTTAD